MPKRSRRGGSRTTTWPRSTTSSTDRVRIRRATPEDARPVAEVHVASWRHAYAGVLPDAYLDRLSTDEREAMWRGAFADPDRRNGAFVAEEGGRVVGFASFCPSRDEDSPEGTGEVPA